MESNQPWGFQILTRSSRSRMILMLHLPLVAFVVVQQIQGSSGQQAYVNNKQLDCDKNHSVAEGYVCNGNGDGDHGAVSSSCLSYLTFRSSPPYYNSPATIGYLLGADPSEIARINNISDVNPIPTDTLVIVPIANCSCFHLLLLLSNDNNNGSSTTESYYYYQHNASYTLKTQSETYFSVANNTYEGLTTCQSLIAQNPYNFRNLAVGMKLSIPLRCACPSPNQTDAGVRSLLTYLVTWGNTIEYIADTFGVDNQSIYDANELSSSSLIFPFTPILVPLKSEPTKIDTSAASPPPPPSSPELPAVPVGNQSSSSRKWVLVGAGIGAVVLLLLALSGFLFWFFRSRRRSRQGESVPDRKKPVDSADYTAVTTNSKSWSVSSEGVRYAIGSLTLYKFEELQKATGFFGEANRIKGSFVYRGSFNGDAAAVKVMKGDVSQEINILKQINHSNIIRLSGFCVHDGNTYLVYEYAENGSLNDWLLYSKSKSGSSLLGWKQRVQIARDIADALNYLHNYTSPPCIHKNLKSSNVLMDGEFRAKLSNFGLARRSLVDTGGSQEELQLTRHVVGTYGYMAPEYIENGLVTPKLDVFAFGVVMLELLSGREAAAAVKKKKKMMNDGEEVVVEAAEEEEEEEEEELLSATISQVVGGDNVREKLRGFIDPCLGSDYPLDLAYSSAQLANNCVAHDPNSRPAISDVFTTLSKILSSSMDWDPSHELDNYSRSISHGE